MSTHCDCFPLFLTFMLSFNVVLVAGFKFKDAESGCVEDFERDCITVWLACGVLGFPETKSCKIVRVLGFSIESCSN